MGFKNRILVLVINKVNVFNYTRVVENAANRFEVNNLFYISIKKLFLICLFTLSSALIYAYSLPEVNYTNSDGLGSSYIKNVYKDKRGYLWFATIDGLSKFDGSKFFNYDENFGLKYTIVNAVTEDVSGNIWVIVGGSINNKLAKFDGVKFIFYDIPVFKESFNNFFIDEKNIIWIINTKYILKFNEAKNNFETLKLNFSDYILDINISEDKVLFLSNSSIYLFDKISYKSKKLKGAKLIGSSQFIKGGFNKIVDNCVYNNGRIYQIIDDQYFLCDIENYNYLLENGDKIYKKSDNNLYVLRKVVKNFDTIYFATNSKIFIENSDNIWVYSDKILKKIFLNPFVHFPSKFDDTWSGFKFRNKFYGIGYNWGIQCIDSIGVISPLRVFNGGDFNTFHHGISVKDQQFFIPTSVGVLKFEDGKFKLVTQRTSLVTYFDRSNDCILSGTCPDVEIYNCTTKETIRLVDSSHIHFCIVSAAKDTLENYWFGSFRGLSKYSICDGRFYDVKRMFIENREIGFTSMELDEMGTLWMGTTDGLYICNYSSDSIYSVSSSFTHSRVFFIKVISSSLLAVGCTEGLYIIDLLKYYSSKHISYKFYNRSNGYFGNEPNQNGAFVDEFGNLIFGSKTITVLFNPDKIYTRNGHPNIFITDINSKSQLYCNKLKSSEISISENFFEVNFDLLGSHSEDFKHFKYSVLGNNDSINIYSDHKNCQFLNLSPAIYDFYIYGTDNFTNAFKQIGKYKLHVSYPYYKDIKNIRNLAVFFFILSVLVSALFIRNILAKKMLVQKQRQNENNFLKIQMLQAQMHPHFIFNVLSSIQELIKGSKTDVAINYLVKLSHLMRNFLDSTVGGDYSEIVKIDNEVSIKREIELINLYVEFEQLQFDGNLDYHISVEEKLLNGDYKLPPLIIQPFVENAIKHGLKPKVENDFQLRIYIKLVTHEIIQVIIIDNGIGRDKSRELKNNSLSRFRSYGLDIVNRRIKVLKEIGYNIAYTIENHFPMGTKVIINFEL